MSEFTFALVIVFLLVYMIKKIKPPILIQ